MGLFYKYKCKKCGKKYFELPVNCDNCETELSFICPCSTWLINTAYQMSKNCEEIHEFVFAFWKSTKTKEFEQKINGLNILLLYRQDEMEELRKKKIEIERELKEIINERWDLKSKNYSLSRENFQLKQLLRQQETMTKFDTKISIPQGTIEAVKYAMKKAHPDNGGNTEDFMRFQNVYKKLTEKES